jgi:ABC-type uncharacterized transport system permease subunit
MRSGSFDSKKSSSDIQNHSLDLSLHRPINLLLTLVFHAFMTWSWLNLPLLGCLVKGGRSLGIIPNPIALSALHKYGI